MIALFTFKGRIGRLSFALVMLAAFGVAYSEMLRLIVDMAIHAVDPDYPIDRIPLARDTTTLPSGVATIVLLLAAAFAIALPLVSLSFLARRFHDFDRSAWFIVPAVVLAALVPDLLAVFYVPPLGLLLLIAVLSLIPGTRGTNRFDAGVPSSS